MLTAEGAFVSMPSQLACSSLHKDVSATWVCHKRDRCRERPPQANTLKRCFWALGTQRCKRAELWVGLSSGLRLLAPQGTEQQRGEPLRHGPGLGLSDLSLEQQPPYGHLWPDDCCGVCLLAAGCGATKIPEHPSCSNKKSLSMMSVRLGQKCSWWRTTILQNST